MALIDETISTMEEHRMVGPDGHVYLRKDDVRLVLQQVLDHLVTDSSTTISVVEVDWIQAPVWAMWWAMDQDGRASWFKHRPVAWLNRWCTSVNKGGHEKHRQFEGPFDNWKTMIRQRPGS